jgi:hypothetical protein
VKDHVHDLFLDDWFEWDFAILNLNVSRNWPVARNQNVLVVVRNACETLGSLSEIDRVHNRCHPVGFHDEDMVRKSRAVQSGQHTVDVPLFKPRTVKSKG